jgi:hypothetical protein
LQGDELSQHLLDEALKKEELEKAEDLNNQIIPDDDDSDLSDGEDAEIASKKGQSNPFDIYVKDTVRIGGFFKINQSFSMFPVVDYRKRVDDYGEVVDPQSFLNADSRLAAAHAAKTDEVPMFYISIHELETKFGIVASTSTIGYPEGGGERASSQVYCGYNATSNQMQGCFH